MQNFKKDNLTVKIYDTRAEMGANAGKEISDCIKTLLAEKEELNMIFAAAPSQNEVLEYLANDNTIPWEKSTLFIWMNMLVLIKPHLKALQCF